MASESTILLSVAYDGAKYSGAATQQNAITVADTLLRALRKLDPGASALRLVSRTDAGVHARDQRVAFDTTQLSMPPRAWALGVIPYLPNDIVVRWAARVPFGFTPRFAARAKHYRYLLYGDRMRDPFLWRRAWHVPGIQGAAEVIHQALQPAQGCHDFAAFAAAADARSSKRCTLEALSCSVLPLPSEQLAIDICGDRFLYNMIRILVGTAVDIGRGRRPADAMARALRSGRREDGGMTAPAHGLYLHEVFLDIDIQERWPAQLAPANAGSGLLVD